MSNDFDLTILATEDLSKCDDSSDDFSLTIVEPEDSIRSNDSINQSINSSNESSKVETADSSKSNDDSIFRLPESEFDLPLRITTFNNAKDYENFVKNVERIVRYSQEYKLWVKYISENLGYSECALTKENLNECSLEIHHHPITLYTIVKAVLNDVMSKEQEFSTFDLATKIIELHFQNKVGYIVLLSDLHKKYHSGFLNLPIEMVHGDYRYIMTNYSIDENEYDRICSLCNVHLEDMKQLWQKDNYPGIDESQNQNILCDSDHKQLTS